MIDCLLDWVDPDNLVRLNGAENEGTYQPPNELLTRIDDLKKVKGWAEFLAAAGWDYDFTLNGTGPVDVLWASRDILLALPGMTESLVDHFLAVRRGPTESKAREDDPQFNHWRKCERRWVFRRNNLRNCPRWLVSAIKWSESPASGNQRSVTRVVQMVVRQNWQYSAIDHLEGAISIEAANHYQFLLFPAAHGWNLVRPG